jgi:hypothetical protein
MAIELDVKPKDRFLFPATVLLVVSISVFSVFLASYIFFEWRSKTIANEMKDIESKLEKTPDEAALEAKIVGYKEKVDSFKQAIGERKDVNKLLAVLEKNAHPSVVASSISWSAADYKKLEIIADTDNMESFSQQIIIWRKIPSLQTITLSALEKGEAAGITFTVQLAFDNGAFK